jgi:hypothetical protein
MQKELGLLSLCVVMLVGLPVRGSAQGGEVFGGYSYLLSKPGSGLNASGWQGSLTGNFNRFIGLEVDLDDHYITPPVNTGFANNFSFLFGPHVAYRGPSRVNPFSHFLVGGTRGTARSVPVYSCPVLLICTPPGTTVQHQTAFTAGIGGGIDVKATRVLWVRVIQVDYFHESFSNSPRGYGQLSFGLVLHFSR